MANDHALHPHVRPRPTVQQVVSGREAAHLQSIGRILIGPLRADEHRRALQVIEDEFIEACFGVDMQKIRGRIRENGEFGHWVFLYANARSSEPKAGIDVAAGPEVEVRYEYGVARQVTRLKQRSSRR